MTNQSATTLNTTVTTNSTTVSTQTKTANTTALQSPMVLIVPSTLSLPLSSSMSIKGYLVPAEAKADITIKSRALDSEWEDVGVVKTDSGGKYEVEWTPTAKGIFEIMASYGNVNSEPQTITVTGSERGASQDPFSSPITIAAIAGVALLVLAVFVFSRRNGKRQPSAP